MTPIDGYEMLAEVLEAIKAQKPNDRSEKDRYHAILVTELQKVMAFAKVYVYNQE